MMICRLKSHLEILHIIPSTPPMRGSYQIPSDIASSEEALMHRAECILEFLEAWDEKLNFPKSGKPILAAEYTSWHALVRAHLNPSTKLEGTDRSASQVDFELA